MKTLYWDCSMGAAGDMLTASLLGLVDDKTLYVEKLNGLGIPGIEYKLENVTKCGIAGLHMSVLVHGHEEGAEDLKHEGNHNHGHDHHHEHNHNHEESQNHHHDHSTMEGIRHVVEDHLNVNEKVRKNILSIYETIAHAESKVHGTSVDQIHFHEVGSMDAIADVSAVCYLLDALGIEKVIASPVHVGSGTVKCAHGILPVPAPATACILEGVPVYGGQIQGELCTPTGAALLKYFVHEFREMPLMKISSIGYGMGKKDFERANCVRAILGETDDKKDDVVELSFNVDDMTPEKIGFAMEQLFECGAYDVYTVPVGMKKNRPGILIRVLAKEEKLNEIIHAIFLHTTTNGIRQQRIERYILNREMEEIETEYGIIRNKKVFGYGVSRSKFEYDDLANAARKSGKSIAEIEKEISLK